jgi:hypothetical protein
LAASCTMNSPRLISFRGCRLLAVCDVVITSDIIAMAIEAREL